MSPVARRLGAVALGAVLLVIAAGCARKRSSNPFDPEAGHAEDFFPQHPASYRANSGSCLGCHGKDLQGGISKVSCYSTSRDGQSCHPAGPGGGHPVGWSAPGSHGVAAKGEPGAATGFSRCSSCHGSDFAGGTAALPCFSCHGVRAPHPAKPWRGSLTHTSTAPGNAGVCAQCHRSRPGDAGCFNNTLCHGQKESHPAGWAAAGSHGTAAKRAPGSSTGMASCEACHGQSFGGASGPACGSCHGIAAPHPSSGWLGGGTSHRATDEGNAVICAQCHRSAGGNAGCFNSTLCHGQVGHPAGWSAPGRHGAVAKSAPGASTGMASCESCHGANFGGDIGPACRDCHGINAPHPQNGWQAGGPAHRTTDQGNAGVCAPCHRRASGTAGCFNGTLCHAQGAGHPANWEDPNQHGASAKSRPGVTSGFSYCVRCHGSNYQGGTSGQSCFPCHGWNAPHGNSWDNGGPDHRTTDEGNAAACAAANCHPSSGGTPGCFNNTLCHGQGGNHPDGWAAAGQHGAAARADLGSCRTCHGSNYAGGTSGQSCFPCHGWPAGDDAAHGRSGWDGGGSRHRVSQSNAAACAVCHREQAGTAGCFNNTLCHGED